MNQIAEQLKKVARIFIIIVIIFIKAWIQLLSGEMSLDQFVQIGDVESKLLFYTHRQASALPY